MSNEEARGVLEEYLDGKPVENETLMTAINMSLDALRRFSEWRLHVTNKEKFKEVFGFEPHNKCIGPKDICRTQVTCLKCQYNEWWNKQYEEGKNNDKP